MKELKGTEKQIAYANTVREYVLIQIENLNVKGLEDKKAQLIKGIEKIEKASVILDSFVSAFRNKEVSAKAVDFLTYREKFTQKDILGFSNTAATINENLKDSEIETKKIVKEEPKVAAKVEVAKAEVKKAVEKKAEIKKTTSGPKFFTAKYDTTDCETTEKIEAGELVWRDNEGIHRADNY